MKNHIELHLVTLHPDFPRNRLLREQIRDNMKLFRAYACKVTIWADLDKAGCELLRSNENLSCRIEPLGSLQSNQKGIKSHSEALILLQNGDIIDQQVPESPDEHFELNRFVREITRL